MNALHEINKKSVQCQLRHLTDSTVPTFTLNSIESSERITLPTTWQQFQAQSVTDNSHDTYLVGTYL